MSTDRELLELAARAFWREEIGDVCSVRWLEEEQAIGYTHAENQDHNGIDQEFVWNPLEDDGDALRLAVKLKLAIFPPEGDDGDFAVASVPDGVLDDFGETWIQESVKDGDKLAATRRAIVCAAAEIGKAKINDPTPGD